MSPTAAAQMALSRDEDSFTELPSNDIFVQKNCKTGKINGVVGTEVLLHIFLLQKGYRLVICECFGTVEQCFEFFFYNLTLPGTQSYVASVSFRHSIKNPAHKDFPDIVHTFSIKYEMKVVHDPCKLGAKKIFI